MLKIDAGTHFSMDMPRIYSINVTFKMFAVRIPTSCRAKMLFHLCYSSVYVSNVRIIINIIIDYNRKINCKTKCKYTRMQPFFPMLSMRKKPASLLFFGIWTSQKFKKNCSTLCVDIDFGRLQPRSFIVPFIAIFIGW